MGTVLCVNAADKIMSGTLSAKIDSQNKTVTAMFVGYCQGEPVIIGPSTWTSSQKEFEDATAEQIADRLCGTEQGTKKVTKSSNNGKEMVAEIVISGSEEAVFVGR